MSRDAGQPWPHGKDVGRRVDGGGADPEGPQELRRGDVDLAVQLPPGCRRAGGWRWSARADDIVGAERGCDGLRSCVIDFGCFLSRSRRARRCPDQAVRGPSGRVDDELVRRHVGPGVVQDVPEPLRGKDADEHGDQHTEADRGQGRARTGPVAGQVAQGQAHRDRGTPAEPAQQRPGTAGTAGSPPRRGRRGRRPARALRRCRCRCCCPRTTAGARRPPGESRRGGPSGGPA